MRQLPVGLCLVVFALGVQQQPGLPFLADWVALFVFWFCLWAQPSAGVLVSWAAGACMEMLGSAPSGMHGITLTGTGLLAALTRQWVRRESLTASLLYVWFFSMILVGAQAFWFQMASGQALSGVREQASRILSGTLVASLFVVPAMQVVAKRLLGDPEPFAA